MDINGLQKLTLLDYPGHVACTVFLAGCNFRCPFCHNSELLTTDAPAVTDDAGLLRFLERRRGLLDGVCFTGGEPLMRKELPALAEKIKSLGFSVKLDTNGMFPARLKEMVGAGLADYVAMDVKNSPERYAETAGLPALDLTAVRESVDYLLTAPCDYEFRTTVMRELHDEASFRAIATWIRGAKRYFLQPFTDRDSVLFAGFSAPSHAELETYLALVAPCVEHAEIRGDDETERH